MTRGILLAVLLLTACKTDREQPGPQRPDTMSCDALAEHLIAICDPFTGEDFRALCETGIGLVTPATKSCIADMQECTEAAVEACELFSVTIACSENDDCPRPFMCELDQESCARCLSDPDCGSGRGCLMGTCFDADSEFYLQLRALFEGDAGAAP